MLKEKAHSQLHDAKQNTGITEKSKVIFEFMFSDYYKPLLKV